MSIISAKVRVQIVNSHNSSNIHRINLGYAVKRITTRKIRQLFSFNYYIIHFRYQDKIFIRGHRLFHKNNLQSTPFPRKQQQLVFIRPIPSFLLHFSSSFIQDKLRNSLKQIRGNNQYKYLQFYGEFSGHDVNMGKGEQKILLSSVTRGLVTQMSDTLIHKKQVQCRIVLKLTK